MRWGNVDGLISSAFRLGAIALLGTAACAPGQTSPGPAAPPEAGLSASDQDAAAERQDAGLGTQLVRLVIHVEGYSGQGLTLGIAGSEPWPVPGAGTWVLPLEQAQPVAELTVLQQGTLPRQDCAVTRGQADEFTVTCSRHAATVGGVSSDDRAHRTDEPCPPASIEGFFETP